MDIFTIDGIDYYNAQDFCFLVKKSRTAIDRLIRYGNVYRKLQAKHAYNRTFIPVAELTEFPFTTGGKNNRVYHYNLDGQKIFT
jgi:hypothetical protein